MLIAIPTGVKIFNWLATVWGGKVRLATPMLFALGFIAQFTIGGLSGVMNSIVPSDTQQNDTYFVVAHFHYVLFGGLVFAIFGGIYYWFPKIFGKMLSETMGKLNFWLMVIGFNLTFFPMHFLGFEGEPRRTYTYPTGMGWGTLNLMSTIGAFIIAVSVLVFLVNVIFTIRRGELAPEDPWDARTLEWLTSSPPPEYNFAEVPIVEARDEFWHRKYTEDDEGRLVKLPPSAASTIPRAARSQRTASHPHAIPVLLAVRPRARVADHGVRLRLQVLLADRDRGVDHVLRTQRPDLGAGDGGVTLMAQTVVATSETDPVVPHTPAPLQTNTGVSNNKLAIWVFIASESLFFGAFISTYFLYRGRDAQFLKGPTPSSTLNIPFTSVTSFVLLMSSLTMVLALAAIRRGDHRRFRIWILATAIFGMTFISGQVYEFTEFYREGLHLGTNLFGTTFFVLTGLHGAHVTIGIVWLLTLYGRSMQGKLGTDRSEAVEIAGLYWHFVDVVWIFIFTAVYLIPQH